MCSTRAWGLNKELINACHRKLEIVRQLTRYCIMHLIEEPLQEHVGFDGDLIMHLKEIRK